MNGGVLVGKRQRAYSTSGERINGGKRWRKKVKIKRRDGFGRREDEVEGKLNCPCASG